MIVIPCADHYTVSSVTVPQSKLRVEGLGFWLNTTIRVLQEQSIPTGEALADIYTTARSDDNLRGNCFDIVPLIMRVTHRRVIDKIKVNATVGLIPVHAHPST